jgi:hypothetical protein
MRSNNNSKQKKNQRYFLYLVGHLAIPAWKERDGWHVCEPSTGISFPFSLYTFKHPPLPP